MADWPHLIGRSTSTDSSEKATSGSTWKSHDSSWEHFAQEVLQIKSKSDAKCSFIRILHLIPPFFLLLAAHKDLSKSNRWKLGCLPSHISRENLCQSFSAATFFFFFHAVISGRKNISAIWLHTHSLQVLSSLEPCARRCVSLGGIVPPLWTRILNALQQWEETPLAVFSFVGRINKPEKTTTNLLQPSIRKARVFLD